VKILLSMFPGCVVLAALLSVSVVANSGLFVFEDLDENTDGWIDRSEAMVRHDLIKNWKIIDSDNDGVIGDLEYLRYEGRELYVPPYDSQDLDPGAGPI